MLLQSLLGREIQSDANSLDTACVSGVSDFCSPCIIKSDTNIEQCVRSSMRFVRRPLFLCSPEGEQVFTDLRTYQYRSLAAVMRSAKPKIGLGDQVVRKNASGRGGGGVCVE